LKTPTHRGRISCALFVAASVVFGCRSLPSVEFSPPFGRSNWVSLEDAQVIDGARPALAVTIANERDRPIWIRMEIDEIEGWNDCTNSFRLDPQTSHRYSCPQTSIAAGTRFRAELLVFRDRGNTQAAERIRRLIEVKRNERGDLMLEGRPSD
jgi:hypothetical protein